MQSDALAQVELSSREKETAAPWPTPAREFWAGAKATLPLEIGAAPFGLIFGAVAVNSGLSSLGAAALSAIVFAGASQFVAVGLVAGGAGLVVIILTTLIVNLRHALYATTLAPHMRHLPHRWLAPLGFWLTDESFVIVMDRYNRSDRSPYKHYYFLGSAVFMYVNWQVWTWIGIVAGQSIPNPEAWGLQFALPVSFIGMLVPALRRRSLLLSALTAGAAALVFAGLPYNLGLVTAALLGVAVGVITAPWDKGAHDAEEREVVS